jgi:hypothetical protein
MTDTFDYLDIRDTADELLAEFGQTVLLRRTTNSGPADEPTQTVTDYTTKGVIVNLPRWYPAFADNSDILRTDRLGYIAMGPLNTAGVVPTPFDLLVDVNGTVFRIIDAKPVYPAGLPVIYTLQLRT